MDLFEKEVIRVLKKATGLKGVKVEVPPSAELGDYAFPCFVLAQKEKKNPHECAVDLQQKIKKTRAIEKTEVHGPYLNFFVKKEYRAEATLSTILTEKEKYGSQKQNKTVVIESPGPNTNKPLHLGHLRNMALGIALKNIFTKLGNKTVIVDIVNDRGVHICKSMLAYEQWGNNKKPDKKADHFVGDFYVLYNKKATKKHEEAIQVLLKKWEEGDTKTRALWKTMNAWAIKGFHETYTRFGIAVDKAYYESEHYQEGKELVIHGYKKGLFTKDDNGAIIVDLEKEKLGKKVLLRADGTSVYVTQDMNLAVKRHTEWRMDTMIYVVASEQIYHFTVLFAVLKLMGHSFVKNYFHLAYGMVNLPEGKMKSREGTVVDADTLMDETAALAQKEILLRHKDLSKTEIGNRAESIGLGAIKFYILKHDPLKDFTYDPKESIAFEGETGPYVQYAHTRISGILAKASHSKKANYGLLTAPEETALISLLGHFPRIIEDAATHYKPSYIATYLLQLAQAFNPFYDKHPVLKAEKDIRDARLHLIAALQIVLKNGLALLGIDALKRM